MAGRENTTLAHHDTLPGRDPMDESVRRAFDGFRLEYRLGEGGMGEVWLAEQLEPVRRKVALKVIKAGMDSKEVVARFESERQALAMMDHPAIARIFDGGTTPEGRPYVVMEYVPGLPITEHCDTLRLSTAERIELLGQVCEGVQHAHQKAVIHRDLKPSNILVSTTDGKPQPKIIDFGIAKAIGLRLTDRTLYTQLGTVIGTPEYMSPEQADATGQDVDTRTDVYSLGVVLYQLLTGTLPFSSEELRSSNIEELRRKLREEDPPRPSSRVMTVGAGTLEAARTRGTDPESLFRQLEGDLDAITLKALEKERSRRYGTPSELAQDLWRYLHREPVLAHAPSRAYRVRRYVQRHRLAVGLVGGLAVLLVGFAVSMGVQARRTALERDRANREAAAARTVSDFLIRMFNVSDPSEARGNTITARELLDRASSDVDRTLAGDPELQARMMFTMGTVYRKLGLLTKAEPLLERSLQLRRARRGPDHEDSLESAMELAMILWHRGRYPEAERLLRQVVDVRKRVLGLEHKQTLDAMNDLGLVLKDGERPGAEPIFREVHAVSTRLVGPEHIDTLRALLNLASTLQESGREAEAEPLQRQALEISGRVLGADAPVTLIALTNLANTLKNEGEFTEAEALQREALERKRRVLGGEHPNTLNAMASLADILAGEDRLDEAETFQRQALEARRRVIGVDNPYTSLSRLSLARYAARRGRIDEALDWIREAIEHGIDAGSAGDLGTDPGLAALRGDPRFVSLVERGKKRAESAAVR
jgi:non-specific serine/threonine protein kinase/serine/threonine-protein kinase